MGTGRGASTWSGFSERSSVVPLRPFCPPGLRPFTGVRFGARGFLNLSLDGGLLLLVLFKPRRRSNSEINTACLATVFSNSRIRASVTARASTKACTSVVGKKGKRNYLSVSKTTANELLASRACVGRADYAVFSWPTRGLDFQNVNRNNPILQIIENIGYLNSYQKISLESQG